MLMVAFRPLSGIGSASPCCCEDQTTGLSHARKIRSHDTGWGSTNVQIVTLGPGPERRLSGVHGISFVAQARPTALRLECAVLEKDDFSLGDRHGRKPVPSFARAALSRAVQTWPLLLLNKSYRNTARRARPVRSSFSGTSDVRLLATALRPRADRRSSRQLY